MTTVGQIVTICHKNDVWLSGRVILPNGKLGHYEVWSDRLRDSSFIYHSFAEAESKFNYLVKLLDNKKSQNN